MSHLTSTPSYHAHFADLEQQMDIPPPAGLASALPPPAFLSDLATPDLEKATNPTPILDDIYTRFSPQQKTLITSIVSFSALLAPFASSSFLPSIPQLARDLSSTASTIDYTISIYLACLAIAPLAWAPYAAIYGRRPIYLLSLPFFIAGSVGTALSHSLGAVIASRTIQAIGSSSVLSVGAGTIGDLFRPTQRGRAMGIYYAGALLGPALAPVIAGILTEYATGPAGGWRSMQWLLAAMGVVAFGLTFFFLPETIHVKGIDKILALKAQEQGGEKKRWVWVWLNPLRPLGLLRYPNVLAVSFNSSLVLLTTYCLLVPLTYTLGPRFGISNAAILGSLYLSTGLGNLIGSRIAGHLSDNAVATWITRRSGLRIPEDRLRASLISGGLVVPLSLLGTGFTMQYWTGPGGLAVSLIFLVISGIGLMGVLTMNNTYLVDVCQAKGRSVEAIAVNNCMRYLFSAGASAGVLPLIKAIDIGPTDAIAAGISWVGFALVLATIRWGRAWRERVDGVTEGEMDVRGPSGDEEKDVRTAQASRRTSMTLRDHDSS